MEFLTRLAKRWNLASHFCSSIRKRGVRRTVQIAIYELFYDTKFRIKTGIIIPTGQLDGDCEALKHATDYFPSSYLVLHEAFAASLCNNSEAVLIDFGCGLGRALLFASTLPFRRIIGVELSPSLCAAARVNIANFYCREGKREPEWSVINADARVVEIPDDANVFYFFNPFDASVLRDVINRIIASFLRVPRRCMIIYANPVHEYEILARPLLKLEYRSSDYVVYCLIPDEREST